VNPAIPSPSYIVDEKALEANLKILDAVQQRAGCKILLALKGFAMFSTFPLVSQYLAGTCASGLYEARLGYENFGKEVHVFAPAYKDDDFENILNYADHIVFNSFAQWQHFKPVVENSGNQVSCGLRINPGYSEIKTALYDPCGRFSRLGIRAEDFPEVPDGIDGLHFHCMCEQNSDTLERLLAVVEEKFGRFLSGLKWVNFGGGHHITRDDYDVDRLCNIITTFKEQYGTDVYLEPGEAIALNTGVLVATVIDIVQNEMDIAILDTSAEAHMPDVLAMPYRPEIIGAGKPGEFEHTYRLGGETCLAGDIIGDFSFPEPLQAGSKLIFTDMAHYSMVKNTTFNGIPLPSIVLVDAEGNIKTLRKFGYDDYKQRLS
jgi:carboxynorspermidine decarboxylase